MDTRRKNIFTALITGAGIIWLIAKPIGSAILWLASLVGHSDDLQALWQLLAEMDKAAIINQFGPWLLVLGGGLSLAWINLENKIRGMFRNNISKDELAKKCEEISQEITDFMFERESQSPPFHPLKHEEHSQEKSYEQFALRAQYGGQTRNLYAKKISPKMYNLCSMLRENGHRPDELLTHGEDAWADVKSGKLLSYARMIRQGQKIIDDRQEQLRLAKEQSE